MALRKGYSLLNLAFTKIETSDSDDKILTSLKDIASDMVYITKK